MCGIFGFSLGRGLDQSEIDDIKNDIKLFVNFNLLRGSDTFGLCINSDDKNYVFKSNINPDLAIKKKNYKNFIDEKLNIATNEKKFLNYFGHTRLVTNGAKFMYENNQPITSKRISGLHNGIFFHKKKDREEIGNVVNHESFEIQSDSSIFFKELDIELLNEKKSSIECFFTKINEFTGSFSLSFNDLKEGKIIISSNTGSLFYYHDTKNRIFVYASEKSFIKGFLKKTKFLKNKDKFEVDIKKVLNKTILYDYITSESFEFENSKNNLNNLLNVNKSYYQNYETITNNQEELIRLKNLKRCSKCILPETYPFIEFDENGICNFCDNYEKQIYLGEEKLEEYLKKYRKKGSTPDCLIGLSGGRDSCYALHLIKKKYNMKPIAYSYDWGLTTSISRLNAGKLTGQLGVEHILRSANIGKKRKYVRKNIMAWLRDPHLGMLPIVQAGDKDFMSYGRSLCKDLDLGFCIHGTGYQVEQREFFLGFAGINQKLKDNQRMSSYSLITKLKMFLWYSYRTLKNPSYINEALLDNFKGYVSSFIVKENFLHIYKYIKWDEKEMNDVLINEYGWLSDKSYGLNQWRMGDGQTAFNNFIYYHVAGFSEFDNFRANQVREGLIDRDTALKLAEKDNLPRYETLQKFSEIIGFSLDDVLSRIVSLEKIY